MSLTDRAVVDLTGREQKALMALLGAVLSNSDQWPESDLPALRRVWTKTEVARRGRPIGAPRRRKGLR